MPDFGGSVARMQEFSTLLFLGLSKVFKDDLPTHPELFRPWLRVESAKEFTEDGIVTTGFGPMPEKQIGGAFSVDKPKMGTAKEWTLKSYGLGFVAEYELIRWEKYGVFKGITKKLSRSGVDRKNVLAHAILNNSFVSTDAAYTVHNGEALIATSHALLRGGTTSNRPATATALSYVGLQEALTSFATAVNEDGLFIAIQAAQLVCHPAKEWEAQTLLGSEYRPDNANMNKNTLSGKLSIVSSPYLTSQTAWWVLASKESREMSFDQGDDLEFRKDFDQSTWNNLFSMYMSARVAVLHWYGTYGTPGV
mgnify:CR=1 FL=1